MSLKEIALRPPVRNVLAGISFLLREAYELDYQARLRARYDIDPTFRIGPETRMDGEGEIHLGPGGYTGCRTTIQSYKNCRVFIGRSCAISHDVKIYTMNRTADQGPRWIRSGDVKVGDDCWICAGVMVLEGVTVGHDSVIGAHAVVTHDIPPHSIAVGAPAHVIRTKVVG